MTTTPDPQHEDYVLVPKRKVKLSKARKLTVLAMVVGAVMSLAGAGTFASFSASTENDASFNTARLALRNGGPSGCTSPAGVAGNGSTNAAVDTNDATNCPTLFPTPLKPAVIETATVTIENVGDVASNIYLFADAACSVAFATSTFNRGTATDLCSRVDVSVESGGNCLYPAGAGACPVLVHATANQSFYHFSDPAGGAQKDFAAKITAASNVAVNGSVSFTVKVRMKQTFGTGPCGATDANNDGFIDSNGRGCDNKYQNQKASLKFKWLAQAV